MRLTGRDLALVPGSPLTHPDHEWLVLTLARGRLGCGRIALYAEQPYTRRAGDEPRVPGWVSEALGGGSEFEPVRTRCATGSRSGVRSGATARSSPCSGCAGASGEARTATRSLPNGSPGHGTNLHGA